MRRSDRQILDQSELKEIIAKADVCHLGFAVNNEPYIVAMNFGFFWGNKPVLYFHCASEGRKLDMMGQNSRVCFQMDLAHELVTADSACSWSMKYKSVVGYGNLECVELMEEKKRALDLIMNHYGYSGTPDYPEAMLIRIKVLRLEILQIEGKKKD